MLLSNKIKQNSANYIFTFSPQDFSFCFFFFSKLQLLFVMIILTKKGNHLLQEVNYVYHGGIERKLNVGVTPVGGGNN